MTIMRCPTCDERSEAYTILSYRTRGERAYYKGRADPDPLGCDPGKTINQTFHLTKTGLSTRDRVSEEIVHLLTRSGGLREGSKLNLT